MGRKRKSNPLNLPPRVYAKHGAFYYNHPDGRWERLGTDLATVKSRAGAIITNTGDGFGTVAYWFDEFLKHCKARVTSRDFAQRTLDDYTDARSYLVAFFGALFPAGVDPPHVAEYLDTNRELGRGVRANRERAALSSMFTWLIRNGKGDVKINPCRGVVRNKETKRARYVEGAEMTAALAGAPVQVWALAHLVYRTLQRPEDIITWTPADIVWRHDAGGRRVRVIRNDQSKTGKIVDIEVTAEIRAILAKLRPLSKVTGMAERKQTLLHTRKGKPYSYDGLAAMLTRRRQAAQVAPFGYYDLKGKGATDMWLAGVPLERIQVLCGHESITTTERYVKSRWRGVVTPNQVVMAV